MPDVWRGGYWSKLLGASAWILRVLVEVVGLGACSLLSVVHARRYSYTSGCCSVAHMVLNAFGVRWIRIQIQRGESYCTDLPPGQQRRHETTRTGPRTPVSRLRQQPGPRLRPRSLALRTHTQERARARAAAARLSSLHSAHLAVKLPRRNSSLIAWNWRERGLGLRSG